MEEMEHATMDFNPTNVIGTGGFGVVYKGLLRGGTAVAIKRRHAAVPNQQFPHQVIINSAKYMQKNYWREYNKMRIMEKRGV